MVKLVERIDALAGAIRDKFNQVMPRLLPPGGTAGQALVKASDADNSFLWADVEGGTGGGPISDEQLPRVFDFWGSYDSPAAISVDEHGRVTNITPGELQASFRGAWQALPATGTLMPSEGDSFDVYGTEYGWADNDGSGTIDSSVFDLRPDITSSVGAIAITAHATDTNNQATIIYKLTGTQGQITAQFRADRQSSLDNTVDGTWKTKTLTLNPGAQLVSVMFKATDFTSKLYVASITVPVQGYAFGDVVTYAGKSWQCVQAGTSETPGTGSTWKLHADDILPANNLWNGTNTFAGSVALNGTATAVTAAAGTNSTLVATTEFVASATGALTPRLVPLGGNTGQVLMKASNSDNALQWGTPSASVSWGGITGTLTSQTDLSNALNLKANLASPALTGTPTAPTAAAGTSSTQIATTAFVQNAVPAVPSYSFPYQNTGYYTTAGVRGTTIVYPNFISLTPFSTVYPITLGSLAVQITTQAGSGQARFGIYTLNQSINGRVFTLVTQPQNATSWSSSSTMLVASYTFTYTLPPGKYFLALQTNAQVTVRSLEATDGLFADTIGCGSDSLAFGGGISGFGYSWQYTAGLVSSSSGFGASTSVPLIGIKSF